MIKSWIHFLRTIFSKHIKMFLSNLKFVPFLCKRKDVKGVEESQPTGPRSRYEPYWTYQVQGGWLDHVELSNPVRGGVSPPFRAAPGRGCNPTVKDSWQTQCQELDFDTCGLLKEVRFSWKEKNKNKVYTCTAGRCCSYKWLETVAMR